MWRLHDIGIGDLGDPADAVLFARGAGVQRVQFAISAALGGRRSHKTGVRGRSRSRPRPDDEHVVPGGAGTSVIIVAVQKATVAEPHPFVVGGNCQLCPAEGT